MSEAHYEAADIRVLKGLEAVRKRPAMYIGDTAERGLHQLVYEVVDNSIDEVFAGYCRNIEVILGEDGSVTVEDDGRGIPVGIHPEAKRPAVEVVMCTLHAGSKFGGGGYKVAGGLHGVGVSCTNALSKWLEVNVRRDGKIYRQRYERGVPVTELEVVGKSKKTGTKITFVPDPEIFEKTRFDFDIIAKRLRELSYLNAGVKITLKDERTEAEEVFHHKGGLREFVDYLNRHRNPLHKPIYISGKRGDTSVEVAIQYHDQYHDNIFSFANAINTIEGGAHLSGFKRALTSVINAYARDNGLLKEKERNFNGDDVREGLTAVISVKLLNPQFEGQTKTKLGNSELDGYVMSIVHEGLTTALAESPSVARRIVNKCITAMRARDAARKQAELVRRKSAFDGAGLPDKLKDCSSRNPEECELFLVEGDSAGGSAIAGRDSRHQAVLPLRGKILNVEKARLDKMLNNAEIQALIAALGTGIAEPGNSSENGENGFFDLSKLRYNKIIIMADADVDGSHIRTLILTFFFRYMRPLIEHGHLYIAQPPLYAVKAAGKSHYVFDDKELENLRAELGRRRFDVKRFKGLGEMNADQLAQTTMEPETRVLKLVTLSDAIAADAIFRDLMGGLVEPRREFIVKYAREVENLDLWA